MTLPASLDFPGRTTLGLQEIAARLACTPAHILHLVRSGEIIKGKAKVKASILTRRVSVDGYRKFLLKRCTSRRPAFTPAEIPWPSCDFTGTRALTVEEIGQRWQYTATHVTGWIEEDSMAAFDLRGARSERSCYRIPVEAYRHFINARIICPAHIRSRRL